MEKQRNKKLSVILLAAAVALSNIILHRLNGMLIRKLPIETYWYQRLLIQTGSALIACCYLFAFKKQFILREKGRKVSTYWVPLLIFLLYGVRTVYTGLGTVDGVPLRPVPEIISFCVTMLLVGVSEEFVHRGVIMNQLTSAFGTDSFAGALMSCLIGGTLFGLIHLFNLFSEIEPLAVVMQTVTAIGMGWVLSALYLRCRNIYVMILIHALVDFTGMIAAGLFAGAGTAESTVSGLSLNVSVAMLVIISFSVLMLFAGMTLLLLRKGKMHYSETGIEYAEETRSL